jgi:membrane protein implicated in regulation of membrane protease activity
VRFLFWTIAPFLAGLVSLAMFSTAVSTIVWLCILGFLTILAIKRYEKHNKNRRRWNE